MTLNDDSAILALPPSPPPVLAPGKKGRPVARAITYYSPVSNIGDIRSLEEGSDEGSIVLDADEVGLDTFLEQFV